MLKYQKLVIYVDGASRGNPGHSSFGVVIEDESGSLIKEIDRYLGENTNNYAEGNALKCALEEALNLGAEELSIYTDSELIAKQFQGLYKIKNPALQTIFSDIRELEKKFKSVKVSHIPRSSHPGNKRADQLANIALNKILKS